MPDAGILITFFILLCLEIVLGFDNILMISIISNRVELTEQNFIRYLGLLLAAVTRIFLLCGIAWVSSFQKSFIYIGSFDFSTRDIILTMGGLFLIWKSIKEIHATVEHKDYEGSENKSIYKISMFSAIIQIVTIDAVFSMDAVITAIGLTENLIVIIFSILVSVCIMIFFVNKIALFIKSYISVKILSLVFMLVIGATLCLEAFDRSIPKQYLYAPLLFALFIQLLQIRYEVNKRKRKEMRVISEESMRKLIKY
ncbi:TerC family protein [Fluviispira multicolorata]|uniref:TerC family protein n=1 Tax=Fluviispira multicolorata TaxID=2654512 RepID=A0A833N1K2_9BACT|nr:TerC family protein [Fluviispira multicolorata]KAB8030905.1 TerC family protein [Fluviispira multicolorata]